MAAAKVKLAAAIAAGLYLASLHGGHGVSTAVAALGSSAPASVSGNVALSKNMAAAGYGWTGSQWDCLYTLWQGESAFDQYNTYPSHDTPPSVPGSAITTAYGIPQALPAQKMASSGADWQTNPATQVKWGLGYISTTYGSPCAALAFKRASGNQGY
jgi:hypothetical protein